jgi:hypothetical protein
MSMLSLLRERLGQPERASDGFLVKSGSPARYELHADAPIVKSISAIKALARRHVPLVVAKRQVEQLMTGRDIATDVPMLEDAAAFESELRELGIRATRIAASAAAED